MTIRPCFTLSGFELNNVYEATGGAPISDYIVKPFNGETLRESTEKVLRMNDTSTGTHAETLLQHIAACRQLHPKAKPEWVAEAVEAVLACVEGQPSSQQPTRIAEIENSVELSPMPGQKSLLSALTALRRDTSLSPPTN
jgi:DNA-binding response OmpR family regulator